MTGQRLQFRLTLLFLLVVVSACDRSSRVAPLSSASWSRDIASHFSTSYLSKQNMTLDCGSLSSRKYLVYGWSAGEFEGNGRSFVWAEGEESGILVPLSSSVPLYLRFRAKPFFYEGARPQTATILANSRQVSVVVLRDGWHNYTVYIPEELLKAGNNVVSFRYGWSLSPRELGLGRDVRKLSAGFDVIRYTTKEEGDVPLESTLGDIISAYSIVVEGKQTSVLSLPPAGAVRQRILLPGDSFLSFRLSCEYPASSPGSRGELNPVRIQVAALPVGSTAEQVIFDQLWPDASSLAPAVRGDEVLSGELRTDRISVSGQPVDIIIRTLFSGSQSNPPRFSLLAPVVKGDWPSVRFDAARVMSSQSKRKVFLLGLDGLTWDLMEPMMADGLLPHLKGLVDRGFSAPLATLLPSKSPLLWTSLATGKHSEAHGITDYVSWDPETQKRIPVTVNLRKTKAVWNIAGDLDKRVMVLGWWPSWPAEQVNGMMVSDRRGSQEIPHQTYPESLLAELHREAPPEPFDYRQFLPYPLDHGKRSLGPHRLSEPEYRAVTGQLLRVQKRDSYYHQAALYLLKKEYPDLFAIYINGVDPVCHLFWKYQFPELYAVPDEKQKVFSQVIPGYYQYVDSMVGELLNHCDHNTVVMIVSDHGFGSEFNRNFKIDINQLMELTGYLHRDPSTGSIDETKTLVQRGPSIDASLDQRMILSPSLKADPAKLASFQRRFSSVIEGIVSKTTKRAPYSITWQGGVDYDFTITVDYRSCLDEPLFIGDRIVPFTTLFPEDFVSGSHGWGPDGICIMAGPGVSRKTLLGRDTLTERNTLERKPTILDVTPTILYLLGLPVGVDMVGEPYLNAFSDEFTTTQTLSFLESYDSVGSPVSTSPAQTAIESDQDDSIRNQLRSLGYIN